MGYTHMVSWKLTQNLTDYPGRYAQGYREEVFTSFAEAIVKAQWLVDEAQGVENVTLENISKHACDKQEWWDCVVCAAIDSIEQAKAQERAHHCTSWRDCYCV